MTKKQLINSSLIENIKLLNKTYFIDENITYYSFDEDKNIKLFQFKLPNQFGSQHYEDKVAITVLRRVCNVGKNKNFNYPLKVNGNRTVFELSRLRHLLIEKHN